MNQEVSEAENGRGADKNGNATPFTMPDLSNPEGGRKRNQACKLKGTPRLVNKLPHSRHFPSLKTKVQALPNPAIQ